MKLAFGRYEHTAVGFPGVVLKFCYTEKESYHAPYIVVKGLVEKWSFSSAYRPHYVGAIEVELRNFDYWVRARFKDDASVQG